MRGAEMRGGRSVEMRGFGRLGMVSAFALHVEVCLRLTRQPRTLWGRGAWPVNAWWNKTLAIQARKIPVQI
jgi:hypothetical protein